MDIIILHYFNHHHLYTSLEVRARIVKTISFFKKIIILFAELKIIRNFDGSLPFRRTAVPLESE